MVAVPEISTQRPCFPRVFFAESGHPGTSSHHRAVVVSDESACSLSKYGIIAEISVILFAKERQAIALFYYLV
jgi:hypothetical protein